MQSEEGGISSVFLLFYVYMLFIYMIEVSTWHSEAVPRLFGSKLGSKLGRSELGAKQCHTKLEIGSI